MHKHPSTESTFVEYLKFVIVISFIFALSIIISAAHQFTAMLWMRVFMGIFLIVFGTFKLLSYQHFAHSFAQYDLLAKKSTSYAKLYPFIEKILGFMYLFNFGGIARDLATFIIFGITTVSVSIYLMSKDSNQSIQCACLGDVIKLPLSKVSLIESSAMTVMALLFLI